MISELTEQLNILENEMEVLRSVADSKDRCVRAFEQVACIDIAAAQTSIVIFIQKNWLYILYRRHAKDVISLKCFHIQLQNLLFLMGFGVKYKSIISG